MKKLIYLIFLLNFYSCVSNAQTNTNDAKIKVDISNYFFFNEGDKRIYKSQYIPKQIIRNGVSNNFKDVVTVFDTVIVRTIQINGVNHFYFWENDPPIYYIFTNSYLGGVSSLKKGNLYFSAVSQESDLLNKKEEQLKLLFPKQILSGVDYNTEGIYKTKITYNLLRKETITVENIVYKNSIVMTKTEFFENSKSTDTLWFAPETGLIKWKRSTGRIEVLKQFTPSNDDIKTHSIKEKGKTYINSKGKSVKASELTDAYKFNGDFSTAEYNSDGYLIKEDFWGTTGEMEIDFIIYKYDSNNNLIEELYYYNSHKDSKGKIIYKIWVNEYIYSKSNKLIESKSKFEINDSDYYEINSYLENDNAEVNKLRYSKRHKIKY